MTATNDTNQSHDEANELLNNIYDAREAAQDRLLQLEGLLQVCRMDEFHRYNDEIKGNYFWACSTLLEQALESVSKIKFR